MEPNNNESLTRSSGANPAMKKNLLIILTVSLTLFGLARTNIKLIKTINARSEKEISFASANYSHVFSGCSKEQNDSLRKKSKNFYFAIYIGSVYSLQKENSKTRTMPLTNTPSEDTQTIEFPSSSQKGVMAINAGINLEFRMDKNNFLFFGFNYFQANFVTKTNTLFNLKFQGNASPNPYYYTTTNLQIKEQFSIITLPIGIMHRLNGKKFSYSWGGGVSLTSIFRYIIIETPGLQYGELKTVYDESSLFGLSLPLSLFVKAGIYCRLYKNILLGFEPEFKYVGPIYNFGSSLYTLSTLGGNLVVKF